MSVALGDQPSLETRPPSPVRFTGKAAELRPLRLAVRPGSEEGAPEGGLPSLRADPHLQAVSSAADVKSGLDKSRSACCVWGRLDS